MEFFGCFEADQEQYDLWCDRCEAGFYCLGDGKKIPCAKGGRPKAEHSYGGMDTCSDCPKGRVIKIYDSKTIGN